MARINKRIIEVKTKYGIHKVVLEPDEKKGYIVTAPGLPGVITWGKRINHAKKMAREAIELCIECLALEKVKESRVASGRTERAVTL